jgi:hypothetical protein
VLKKVQMPKKAAAGMALQDWKNAYNWNSLWVKEGVEHVPTCADGGSGFCVASHRLLVERHSWTSEGTRD